LNAPVELIKTGYYAGFGEKNSMGFGCVEIKRQLNNLLAPGEAGIDSVEKNKKYKQNETNLQND
jgi:hypothetical protein